jgi:hypothetical protein
MKTTLLAGTFLSGVLCFTAAAQIPPPIIRLIRTPAFGTVSNRPYVTARAAVDVVGMTSATGLPERWVIEQHATFASIEDLDNAIGAMPGSAPPPAMEPQDEVLGPAHTMIAYYRPGWGYRPEEAVRRLPRARYIHVTIYRMRPGSDDELEKLMRARRERMDSVNLDRPDLVYHVISGATSGLYLVLAPMVSLRILDDGVAKLPVYAEPIAEAEANAGQSASTGELLRESLLFRIDPRLSYVSDDFAAADPAFWHPPAR